MEEKDIAFLVRDAIDNAFNTIDYSSILENAWTWEMEQPTEETVDEVLRRVREARDKLLYG